MRHPCLLFCMLGLCAVPAAHAATPSDLRATLSQMHAVKPLSATIQIHDHEKNGKKDEAKSTDTRLTLHIDDAADGLSIRFPTKLLDRANKQAHARADNPDAPAATLDALTGMDPTLMQAMADFTPALLNKLVGAKLTTHKSVMRGGHSVDLMTFSVPSGVGAADKDSIKKYSGYLKVWLAADGVPVAAQTSQQYKGSKFFISFSFGTVKNYTFKRIGQRLVVTHYQRDQHSSGLGHVSHSKVDITLSPDPVAGSADPGS